MNQNQLEIPIQPVERPILCNPYEEPNAVNLIVEIKGHETEQDRAKHEGARRWVSAVNNWNELGKWDFHVCRDPQLLECELAYIVQSSD